MASDPGQERKLQEEEAKLTATWVSGLGLAFAIAGIVQPLVTGSFSASSLLLFGAGLVLHWLARFLLRRGYPLEKLDGPA
jgi:hypothetical protein